MMVVATGEPRAPGEGSEGIRKAGDIGPPADGEAGAIDVQVPGEAGSLWGHEIGSDRPASGSASGASDAKVAVPPPPPPRPPPPPPKAGSCASAGCAGSATFVRSP